jgi:acyl-CoA synthetase (AMP-forming)/AMP-acid ligase II
VVAVIVPSTEGLAACEQDSALAEREVQRWMRERLAGYQVPKAIVWRDALPQNAMGKVQKHELLSELRAAELES